MKRWARGLVGSFASAISSSTRRKRSSARVAGSFRIQDQSLRLLALLVERPRALVTRDELRKELWLDGECVDFDRGINSAVNRLRRVLGDLSESPVFVETVPRRGYRFVAPIEEVPGPEPAAVENPLFSGPSALARRSVSRKALALSALSVIAVFSATLFLLRDRPAHGSSKSKVVLAVLPFADVSADPEPHLGDGLTEEVIGRLGGLAPETLGVIARTTVMTYKSEPKTIEVIGRELNVDYVLEGSVRRDDDDVTIMVRLIEVEGQTQLWTDSYEVAFGEVRSAQIDVVQSLNRLLLGESSVAASDLTLPPINPRAYDAYLKGIYFRDMLTEEGFLNGIDRFEESISYEPEFAPAYAGMAACYCLLSGQGLEVDQPDVLMSKARSMAERALRLDADPTDSSRRARHGQAEV